MKIDPEITEFKKYLIANNISGLALDIDDTLSQTKKCWFDYFSRIIGNPENLTSEEFCLKYPLIQDAPYYQTPKAQELINQMAGQCEIYENLELVDNSLNCVNQINQIIPIAAYITMRPQSSLNITQKWLDKHGFPKAKLISRPDSLSHLHSVNWKASVLEELYPQIVGIVDDSLGIAQTISTSYQGKIFLYNFNSFSSQSGVNVIPCQNWACVLDKITHELSRN